MIWGFIDSHPIVAFFMLWITLSACVETPFKLVRRWIRHRDISAWGWPPEHIDADGDFKDDDELITKK